MPDRYGFDHLGDEVRCIDCPAGGPLGRWPEYRRCQHAHTHERTTSATDLRRQRPLLAASPPTSNEEKEASMATTTKQGASAKRCASAKQVAIEVLRKAGEPLHANEITKRVLASGRCAGLKGKTPDATISAMLAVGSKPGGLFTRVDKGTYTLASSTPTERNSAQTTSPKRSATKAATRKPSATGRSKTAGKRTTAKRSR
jgi:hypothetical protein